MNAVLLAGGRANPDDPMYATCASGPKALLPVAGKPMAQWVIDALAGASSIDRLIVVGLEPDCGLQFPAATQFVTDSGTLLGNIRAGVMASLASQSTDQPVMIVSADIPTLDTRMVDWLANRALSDPADLHYCAIDRQVMEQRFPGSGRTYTRFRDCTVCGGDLSVLRPAAFLKDEQRWRELTERRKSVLRMTAVLGLDLVALLLFHLITIDAAACRAGGRLGISAKVVRCPFPEAGMDIDKPFQHAMVERYLQTRLDNA
jgi:GTP:adenosylcobinamide-phosphate guanylyltransferase